MAFRLVSFPYATNPLTMLDVTAWLNQIDGDLVHLEIEYFPRENNPVRTEHGEFKPIFQAHAIVRTESEGA